MRPVSTKSSPKRAHRTSIARFAIEGLSYNTIQQSAVLEELFPKSSGNYHARNTGSTRFESNPEPHKAKSPDGKEESAENRDRTCDTRIFSPLLYQLSYLGLPLPSFYYNVSSVRLSSLHSVEPGNAPPGLLEGWAQASPAGTSLSCGGLKPLPVT